MYNEKKIKMFMVILISTTVATKSTDIEIEILYSSEIEKTKKILLDSYYLWYEYLLKNDSSICCYNHIFFYKFNINKFEFTLVSFLPVASVL